MKIEMKEMKIENNNKKKTKKNTKSFPGIVDLPESQKKGLNPSAFAFIH